jgi:hypothetical protein
MARKIVDQPLDGLKRQRAAVPKVACACDTNSRPAATVLGTQLKPTPRSRSHRSRRLQVERATFLRALELAVDRWLIAAQVLALCIGDERRYASSLGSVSASTSSPVR